MSKRCITKITLERFLPCMCSQMTLQVVVVSETFPTKLAFQRFNTCVGKLMSLQRWCPLERFPTNLANMGSPIRVPRYVSMQVCFDNKRLWAHGTLQGNACFLGFMPAHVHPPRRVAPEKHPAYLAYPVLVHVMYDTMFQHVCHDQVALHTFVKKCCFLFDLFSRQFFLPFWVHVRLVVFSEVV